MTTTFPLLFQYGDLIAGDGFVAGVEVSGRALLEEDKEKHEVWMYGLNPGGMAGGGETRREALSDFRLGYCSVLYDIAGSVKTFVELQAELERFFNQANAELERRWNEAVKEVRSGKLDTDWLQKHPFSMDDIRIRVRLLHVTEEHAQENPTPTEEMAAGENHVPTEKLAA